MRMERLLKNAEVTHSKDFSFSWWHKVNTKNKNKERIVNAAYCRH